eukprot:NODE_188_length_1233_cov_2.039696_g148_i0.p2 GENE.NODE_188_length_1233_cov_2.039696_g148_i0~~NODE_188_length_1233_cov_2.039696_g148_i0.p2  ORF type:complete len:65 (-),score=2.31 NODE_188_length_1233_cov_2.039696_g148_i0:113-307(-)
MNGVRGNVDETALPMTITETYRLHVDVKHAPSVSPGSGPLQYSKPTAILLTLWTFTEWFVLSCL